MADNGECQSDIHIYLNAWFKSWDLPAHVEATTTIDGTGGGYPQYKTTLKLVGLKKLKGEITDEMVKNFAETCPKLDMTKFNYFAMEHKFPWYMVQMEDVFCSLGPKIDKVHWIRKETY